MTIRKKIVEEIINKIDNISDKKLKDILEYISKIENLSERKETILSFAGKWNKLDEEILNEFTINLHTNRLKDTREIN